MKRNGTSRPRFRPQLETLEDRCCPSVNVSVLFGNTLVVNGDSADNTVTITDAGNGNISALISGATGTATGSGSAIKNVIINTRGGSDNVTYNLNGPLSSK